MNDDIRSYLDGEADVDALPEAVRAEARSWDRLLAAYRGEFPGGPAPAWLEDRVMAEIEALPRAGILARALEWFVSPRPIRLSPAAMGLVFAALATAALWPRSDGTPSQPGAVMPTSGTPVVYVQFSLEAPSARSVSVGGDFDDWGASFALSDSDGDGIWTGRVPVRPGLHTYMFLIDGSQWVTDPEADRYTDDGFGNRNAVLAVASPAA